MSEHKPTNWQEIELQDKIDSLEFICDLLTAFRDGRESGNGAIVSLIRSIAWTMDQNQTISTKVDVEFPYISEISDDLPVSNEQLSESISSIQNRVKEIKDEIYQIRKKSHPDVHKNS